MGIFKKKITEEYFEDTIKLLKGLDRVKAPDNFEFNLMVRINNQEFGDLEGEEKKLKFAWVLPPAAAVALTTIVLFFMLSDQTVEFDNPLFAPPKLRTEFQAISAVPRGPVEYNATETEESKELGRNLAASGDVTMFSSPSEPDVQLVVQPNDVIFEERIELPFDTKNSVNLDSRLQGNDQARSSNASATLVRGGSPVFDFNGFSVRERVSKQEFEAYKSRMDSLKRINTQR
ncbi:MAG: hypothetical protein KKA84_05565 [Bacteroidetes bacterium]|nr:hypothetical protein [Bacteroidota bacterium]